MLLSPRVSDSLSRPNIKQLLYQIHIYNSSIQLICNKHKNIDETDKKDRRRRSLSMWRARLCDWMKPKLRVDAILIQQVHHHVNLQQRSPSFFFAISFTLSSSIYSAHISNDFIIADENDEMFNETLVFKMFMCFEKYVMLVSKNAIFPHISSSRRSS